MKHKLIKSLVLTNLFVICLTNCSITPSNKEKKSLLADSELARPAPKLSKARVVEKQPGWLASLMETAKKQMKEWSAEEDSSPLFPDGFLKNYSPGKPKKVTKITSGYDVRGDSGVTAEKLDKVFKGKLKGKGKAVVEISRKYGIDPLFVAGLACHEANFGLSRYSFDANNVTGQLYKDKKTGKWKPIQFKSVEECLERTCQRMRDIYFKESRTTISSIGKKYCPQITNKKSKDFNDPRKLNRFWPGKIQEHMNKIQSI